MRRLSVANREILMAKLDEFRRNHLWVNNNVIVKILGEKFRSQVNHETHLIDVAGRWNTIIVRCVRDPGGPVYTDVCWQLTPGTLVIKDSGKKRASRGPVTP